MATLLGFVGEVLTFVVDSFGDITDAILAQPLMLFPLGIAVGGMLIGWVRSFLHY
jgi:hypothetical protein